MPGRNTMYRGPEIQIELMRATNKTWQQKSMRNGYLISNAQQRERFEQSIKDANKINGSPASDKSAFFVPTLLFGPLDVSDNSKFKHLSEAELRSLHSQSSIKQSNDNLDTPNSKYCSMTSSTADTSWGEGSNPSIIFKFNVWRSDVWKGNHDLNRDPRLQRWLQVTLATVPLDQRLEILRTQTPPDWDRGAEFEWVALGGTRIYNVRESRDGQAWVPSQPTNNNIDFWWEALL
jgi:hypothetical protein